MCQEQYLALGDAGNEAIVLHPSSGLESRGTTTTALLVDVSGSFMVAVGEMTTIFGLYESASQDVQVTYHVHMCVCGTCSSGIYYVQVSAYNT